MRKRFESQLKLGQRPIEKLEFPLHSRDELPPILAGLQWIYMSPEVNEEIFSILEEKMLKGKKKETGRPGMDLWHVLVLGVVRLGLNCNYDRLEYVANTDRFLRQLMGLESMLGDLDGGEFHHKTLSENVCHIDEEMLKQINQIVVRHGRKLFKKKGAKKIEAKTDSFVLETDVHFPTDLNLLWDANRKSIEISKRLSEKLELEGWRKDQDWKRQLKGLMRHCGRINRGGGIDKERRFREAVKKYLNKSAELLENVNATEAKAVSLARTGSILMDLHELAKYKGYAEKHIDLIERRVLKGEKIPGEEKIYSLFEPHTEWISKGKEYPRKVELGHPVMMTTDQNHLVIDYTISEGQSDVDQAVAVVERLVKEYGAATIKSLSFDRGFSSAANKAAIGDKVEKLIMPKRGKPTKASRQEEGTRRYRILKNRHSAVESNINSLQHHGLKRCPDAGKHGYKRYAGLGILAYNLHIIGNWLQKQKRQRFFAQAA